MPPKGSHYTPEQLARITAANRRPRTYGPEYRTKMSAALKGRKPSPATIAANTGRSLSPESREKIRAKLMGHPVSPEVRAKMSASHKGVPLAPAHAAKVRTNNFRAPILGECVYCFGPASTHDHVIPRSRPGWDEPDNVVLACRPCNRSKGPRTPDEWFAAMTTVTRRQPRVASAG